MSRSHRALAGGAVLALQAIVRIGTTILVAPLLVRFEGQETLGAYSVVLQLISYLVLLELGLSRALSREIAQLSGGADSGETLSRVIGTSALFLLGIGATVMVLTLLLAQFLPLWFAAKADVISSARSALLIIAAWMFFKFPLSLFNVFLFARQRIALYGAIALSGDLLRAFLSVGLVWSGYGLLGLATAMVVCEALMSIASWYLSRYEWRALLKASFDVDVLRRLLAIGLPLSLMSLGDQLTFHSQDLMAGLLMGAGGAATIYAMRMPGFTAASVVWRMIESAVPGLNDLRGRGATEALRSAHHRLTSYVLGAGVWLASGICAFNRPLVEAWVGADLYQTGGVTAGIAFFMLVGTFNAVLTHFLTVEGNLTHYPLVVVFAGLVTLVLGLGFGQYFGLSGVVWGAALGVLVTTPFLVRRNALLLGAKTWPMIAGIVSRGFRCAGLGVAACAGYGLARELGMTVPWTIGLGLSMIVGAFGYIAFGLLPQDRSTLIRWLTGTSHAVR